MARTAVITGTATAVSRGVAGAMDGKQQQKAMAQQQQAYAQQQQAYTQQQAMVDQAAAQAAAQIAAQQAAAEDAAAAQSAAAANAAQDEKFARLTKLGELKAMGVLTEEEFAAEKAKILAM